MGKFIVLGFFVIACVIAYFIDRFNNRRKEEIYWELMVVGAGEDVARAVVSDKSLLRQWRDLKAKYEKEELSKKNVLLKLAIEMRELLAKKEE